MIKRLLTLGAIAAFLALTSCGEPSSPQLLVTWVGPNDGVWTGVARGIRQHGADLGFEVIERAGQDQSAEIRAALKAGTDAIILSRRQGPGPIGAIKEALDSGTCVLVLGYPTAGLGRWISGIPEAANGLLYAPEDDGSLARSLADRLPELGLISDPSASADALLARPDVRRALRQRTIGKIQNEQVAALLGLSFAELTKRILEAIVKSAPQFESEVRRLNQGQPPGTVVFPDGMDKSVLDASVSIPKREPIPVGSIMRPVTKGEHLTIFCAGAQALEGMVRALDAAELRPYDNPAIEFIGVGASEALVAAAAGRTTFLGGAMMPGAPAGVLPVQDKQVEALLVDDAETVGLVGLRFLAAELARDTESRGRVLLVGWDYALSFVSLSQYPREHLSELYR